MKKEYPEGKEKVQGNRIRILDKDTINKIAAGEVIERPVSVVKELIDNSIDARATDIRIEIEKGGKRSILVRDNGCGMSREDALLAYKKHATSKLMYIEDLNTISTMGFRGEALSSITAVAKVEILTRQQEEITGTRIVIHGGKVLETLDAGTAPGTAVHVKDLFYNTPARQKYLKSDRTELAHITDTVMRLALANPEISFTLLSDGKPVIRNAGSNDPFKSIVNLLGPDTARSMLPLEYRTEDFEIRGYISKPETTRRDSDQLFFFVNTRPVISRAINKAVREGYYTRIPKERYPVAVLSLDIDPGEVDVNVHPRKAEVRFSREKEIGDAVTLAIEKVLSESNLVTEIRERRDRIQKTFEIPESSGRLQVSEAAEIFGKIVTGKTRSTHGTSNFPESGGALREKAERYSYPVKDTERKLKKSERLLDFTSKDGILGIPDNRNPENRNELEINKDSLEDLRVIGQVSRLYILAEKGEDLVLIDQHAAHERILYEQILRMKKSRVQELITPITIDLTPKEKVLMEEYIPYLEDYGFGISEFGDNTYVVTFVPEVFGRLEGSEIIHDVVSDLLASGRVKKDTGISERVCKTLACRAAIKAGAACSPGQMEELIEQLKKAENPYSCPHGRPTVITFTKGELDRMFARIQ
ncbi:MAG: DNA mismatch repair endonuclease MutL [Methanosarcina flavescens]|jgi:DNA mismatch repair protein MutL|uniref:DNA mismatch repair protein MutL n=1 Tax=Methanosarcina flavescens TaxID=1715806 RepID=A0A7K4AYP0_9EURY|nr:DNA mismatch repair endonuclease MutL [Methanosarcina flavescens]